MRGWLVSNDFYLHIIFTITIFLAIRAVAPDLERLTSPVVGDLRVNSISPAPLDYGGWSIIHGEIDRLRDCNFIDVQFVMHDEDGGTVTADHVFLEPSKIRPRGITEFGPWLVNLSADQLRSANIETTHECHPVWLSVTKAGVNVDAHLYEAQNRSSD